MTIQKFYCSSTLICPIRRPDQFFWKAENRQAIDSYDDSVQQQNAGHIDFLWIQESIFSVLSAENLFQYEHFHENLK